MRTLLVLVLLTVLTACSSDSATAPTPPCPAGYTTTAVTHLAAVLSSGFDHVQYICVANP